MDIERELRKAIVAREYYKGELEDIKRHNKYLQFTCIIEFILILWLALGIS